MIVGYHIIFGAYGFWLPNDPRGSWSDFVGSWELYLRGGRATRTDERHSLARRPHNHALRLATKSALKHPPVLFTGQQARAIAGGFGRYFQRSRLPAWACAILPDHVHLVVGQPKIDVGPLVIQLKSAATVMLKREGLHPFGQIVDSDGRSPRCFARGQWKVFLDPEDVPRAIQYVEENPVKQGKKPQRWSFVVPWR
jgi:REP element-mobilizing transposase RayT